MNAALLAGWTYCAQRGHPSLCNQPSGDRLVGAVKYLSNVDKHQVIHPSISYAIGAQPEVVVEPSDCLAVSKIVFGRQSLRDGAEVARVQVVEIKPPPEGHANVLFNLPVSVAFGEEGKGVASIGFLAHIMTKLHKTVAQFEPEFS
jgi:hypothetical protein